MAILECIRWKWTLAPRNLKMPDLRAYDGGGEWAGHVQTIGIAFQRGRRGSCAQRLHQMWPDLGRLDAIAEILQVGPFLGHDPEKHALGQKREARLRAG